MRPAAAAASRWFGTGTESGDRPPSSRWAPSSASRNCGSSAAASGRTTWRLGSEDAREVGLWARRRGRSEVMPGMQTGVVAPNDEHRSRSHRAPYDARPGTKMFDEGGGDAGLRRRRGGRPAAERPPGARRRASGSASRPIIGVAMRRTSRRRSAGSRTRTTSKAVTRSAFPFSSRSRASPQLKSERTAPCVTAPTRTPPGGACDCSRAATLIASPVAPYSTRLPAPTGPRITRPDSIPREPTAACSSRRVDRRRPP